MSRQPVQVGTRRAAKTGSVIVVPMSTGELRYHARLHEKYLGSFETRAAAQRAIEAALAEQVAQ
jgi:hypothetical protein